jgi:hypothetical protein
MQQTSDVGIPVERGHPGGLRIEKATAYGGIWKSTRRAILPCSSSIRSMQQQGVLQQITVFITARPSPAVPGINHMDFGNESSNCRRV